jgi:hypothetical protein
MTARKNKQASVRKACENKANNYFWKQKNQQKDKKSKKCNIPNSGLNRNKKSNGF